MKKKLVLLENLHAIDSAIDAKNASQAALRSAIIACEEELTLFKQAMEQDLAQLSDVERQKAELEASLAAELENIKRSESHAKEIRTNKEFQAIGREISAARKQVGELEEQILALTARVEEQQAAVDVRRSELGPLEGTCKASESENQAAIAALQKEIDEASVSRDEIVKQLATNLVRRYYKLREQRRGQALAEVRDGSCLGCNMNLPPQLYNTLFRGDELIFCPHCQRILVLKQEQAP